MLLKLEKKFGRYAISGLMKYVVILYAAGFVINLISPTFYYQWLMLDIDKLLKGQVWRLFTFIIQPMESNVLFMALMLYVYYSIGTTLENVWGTFRFNLYYFMGLFFNMLAVVIIYLIFHISYPVSLYYLNMSMFLAFATTFPEIRFYLMFLIPVKAKYLSIAYVLLLLYDVISAFTVNAFAGICVAIMVFVAMANFIIYFFMTRKYLSPRQIKRKIDFSRNYTAGARSAYSNTTVDPSTGHKAITRHKCATCGRTELDGDDIQFRFCSKCNGNYEYCQDHLFTHTHIQ